MRAHIILVLLVAVASSAWGACVVLPSQPSSYTFCQGRDCNLVVPIQSVSPGTNCNVGIGFVQPAPSVGVDRAILAVVNSATGAILRSVDQDGFNSDPDTTEAISARAKALGSQASDFTGLTGSISQELIDQVQAASGESVAVVFEAELSPRDDNADYTEFSIVVASGAGESDLSISPSVPASLPEQEEESDHGKPKQCRAKYGKWGCKVYCEGKCYKQSQTCVKKVIKRGGHDDRDNESADYDHDDSWHITKKECKWRGGVCVRPYWRYVKAEDDDGKWPGKKWVQYCKKCIKCKCVKTGGHGDPHFLGFNGQKFDFMGAPDRVFNLITDSNVIMNAQFGNADQKLGKEKTYMVAIGIKVNKADKILVACDRAASARILTLNGQAIQGTQSLGAGTTVRMMPDGQLELDTPAYLVRVRFSSSAHSSCHVNFAAKYKLSRPTTATDSASSASGRPVGIIGKTASSVDFSYEEEFLSEFMWENDHIVDGDLFGLSDAGKLFFFSSSSSSGSGEAAGTNEERSVAETDFSQWSSAAAE